MITYISGELVKIAFEDQVDILLNTGAAKRPAARFNRAGERALYLSTDERCARIAMQKYVSSSDAPRVLVRYEIERCRVLDLRHPEAKALLAQSSADWTTALENDLEPTSWKVADKVRESEEVGLIDPSRQNPDCWHIALFQWNEAGGPSVKLAGAPEPIDL